MTQTFLSGKTKYPSSEKARNEMCRHTNQTPEKTEKQTDLPSEIKGEGRVVPNSETEDSVKKLTCAKFKQAYNHTAENAV